MVNEKIVKDNLVSQQMVLDILENIDCSDGIGLSAFKCDVVNDAITAIKALPFIQSEKIRGRWQEITEGDCSGYDPVLAGYDDPVVGYVCSVCHEGYEKEIMNDMIWNYCPNCGARMDSN